MTIVTLITLFVAVWALVRTYKIANVTADVALAFRAELRKVEAGEIPYDHLCDQQ
jgi:hypothetical protein